MSEKTINELNQLTETNSQPTSDLATPFTALDATHVCKVIELVGSSNTSIEAAIESAIDKAAATMRHLRWFEVVQTRGHIQDGKVAHFQAMLKVGFLLE